jgi:hypothetical protein
VLVDGAERAADMADVGLVEECAFDPVGIDLHVLRSFSCVGKNTGRIERWVCSELLGGAKNGKDCFGFRMRGSMRSKHSTGPTRLRQPAGHALRARSASDARSAPTACEPYADSHILTIYAGRIRQDQILAEQTIYRSDGGPETSEQ